MGNSPMNWERIKELFEGALECNPAQRVEFLREQASEQDVRDEVIRLLAEHDQVSGFLSNPIFEELASHDQSRLNPGDLLDGKFRIVNLIAEGGMGQVWLAEQTAPVKRQVVVKLIKAGMYDDALLQRFSAERQSLAIMDHPYIAKILDAGATRTSQPYFVMEYVPGLSITKYCDEKKLNIRDRLQLFIKVCEGVQHAHQKAIIHRDLKPANILITDVDGKPMPRIIDFGIARASSPVAESGFTQTGVFVGTPGYMSPEQTDPRSADVDTRTDVYSLGAILYVLLAGSLPLDPKEWRHQPLDEMLRHLREDDPPRPSTKVSTGREEATATAEARATDGKHLVGLLRRELDWITMKALERDRSRRYGSPSELAADVNRYLCNEPVIACPPSTSYRFRKYVGRHRTWVAVVAGVTVFFVGFGVTQTVQLRRTIRERDRANRERDRANRERDRANHITDFMTSMFKVSNPSESRGNTITAREILDKSSTEVKTSLTNDPELQAQLLQVMGDVYENLGLYPRAQSLQQLSLEIRQRVLGPAHPETLQSMNSLASVMANEGNFAEAEKLQRETLDLRRRVLGPEHPDTVRSMTNLANDLRAEGHFTEAEKLHREALDINRHVLGSENPDTLSVMNGLANDLWIEGQYAEAERVYRETLDIRRRVLGPEHPDTLTSMTNLANDLWRESHYAEAEKLYREALDIRRRVLGPEHPLTLNSVNNLANLMDQVGRYAEAEELNREALAIRRRVLGPEHPDTLVSMNGLAAALDDEGRHAEAEKLYRETLDIRRRVLGPEHPDTMRSMNDLANAMDHEGHYAEAEKLDWEALDLRRRVLGPDHPETANSTYTLACIMARQNRRSEALSLLQEAVEHGLPAYAVLGMDKDPDLKSLHGDARFEALVAKARQNATATAK